MVAAGARSHWGWQHIEAREFPAENAKLASCENDTDYYMVTGMLCNEGAEPVGPYHATLRDDCMAEETDEDPDSMNNGSQEEEDASTNGTGVAVVRRSVPLCRCGSQKQCSSC